LALLYLRNEAIACFGLRRAGFHLQDLCQVGRPPEEGSFMFQAVHAIAEHTITLPLSVDEAFPLFTPEGERLWIAEWNPHYFYPSNGETLVGMVFVTGEGDETTYWTLADFDTGLHAARYCRVTPTSRSVIVEVKCDAVGEGETRVTVRYTLTALSDAGNSAISAFVESYAAMIEDWKVRIMDYLESQPHRVLPGL
jgi:hypothetical protein